MDQVSITSAYMWALIVMVICFLIATLVANLILFKPNNPGTTARRVWFWALCVAAGIIGYVINFFIGKGISVYSIQSDFYMQAGIAAGVSVVIYIILGFVISKIFPNSKVGTWF